MNSLSQHYAENWKGKGYRWADFERQTPRATQERIWEEE